MSNEKELNHKAVDNLGNYVYNYSDTDTKVPFYIGKGKEPIIEVLVHGVDEENALKVETATIDLTGINNLTN